MSDPLYALTVLALDFETPPTGFGSKLILDRAAVAHPCVAVGGAIVDDVYAHDGAKGLRNPGTGYLACGASLDYVIGAGVPFCMEGWVSIDGSQPNPRASWFFIGPSEVGSYGPNAIGVQFSRPENVGKISVYVGNYGLLMVGDTDLRGAGPTHVALTRTAAGDWDCWVNGVSIVSATFSGVVSGGGGAVYAFVLGDPSSPDAPCAGKADDVRLTVGDPRYTAAFTPPATLDLPTSAPASSTRLEHALDVVAPDPASYAGGLQTRALEPQTSGNQARGGAWLISGVVDIAGTPPTPASRRVRLYDEATGHVVRETRSAGDGSYAFTGIPFQLYSVVADDDDERNYNSVVKARVLPVAA